MTHRQIGEARDNLLLRQSLQRWRTMTVTRNTLYQRVTSLSNNRCLRVALDVWKVRLREKEQMKWREMMRSKMKTIRTKRESKLLQDAWATWLQSYRSYVAGQQYTKQLQLRYYWQWKKQLSRIIENEIIADNFFDAATQNAAKRCWHLWRNANEIRDRERILTERIDLRLMEGTLTAWHTRM